MISKEYLTVLQIKNEWGIGNLETIYRWIKKGYKGKRLKAKRMGGKGYRILREDFEEFMQSGNE